MPQPGASVAALIRGESPMKTGDDSDGDDYVEVVQANPPRSPSLSTVVPRCRLQSAKADEDSDDEIVVVGEQRQVEEGEQMEVENDAEDEDGEEEEDAEGVEEEEEEEEGGEEEEDDNEEDEEESEEDEEDSTESSVSAEVTRKSSRATRAAVRYSPQAKSSRSDASTSSRRSSASSSASSSSISRSSSSASASRPSSSTSESGEQYGRGKRQVKARVITIDGYPVMLENNYRLKGEIYDYASDAAEYVSRKKQPSVKEEREKKKAADALKKARAPQKVSDVTKRLYAHNDSVRHAKEKADQARTRFLVHNLDALAPFLEPKVLKALRSTKASLSDRGVTAAKLAAEQKVKSVHIQPEYIVGGELRDYQMHGLSWLIHMHNQGAGAILGDEMGLGKTIQTTAFLGYLKHERQVTGPSLIVCPLSVLSGWMAELEKWCPSLRALRLHTSDQNERKNQCQDRLPDVMSYDVCVTTYEMLKNKILRPTLQSRIHWNYVIFDEGHCLKNELAEVSDVARKLHAYNMVLLTGTPLQNNLHELWSLLSLLFPDVFTSSDSFDDCFRIGNGTSSVNVDMLNKAHELVKPFMLRRLKVEVEKCLPPRIETRIACPLSEMQSFWYKRLLLKERDILLSRMEPAADGEGGAATVPRQGNKADDWKRLQALWVQLRKCCNHPYLFPGAEPEESEATVELMVKASGKLHMMDRLLEKLKAAGHRVVIFSQYTHMLDIIDDYLHAKGHSYTRLDGSTNRVQRFINIKRFNQPDSNIFCFIMTTRAGGLGVNLQTADTVILFDSDWNPQPDLQAMARVHRIGQTKVVHVYRLVVEGTIEERVVQHSEKKLYLDQMVNRDSLAISRSMGEEEEPQKKDLLEALTFGADRIFKASSSDDVQTLSDADLDAIIDRTTTAQDRDDGARLLKADKKDAATFDPNSAYLKTRELQGVLYTSQPASVADITQEWQALQRTQRSRNQRLVMVPGLGSGYGSSFVPVLAQNMYDLQSGEASVFDRELAHRADPAAFRVASDKRKKATAGRDYNNDDYCLHCWDGGDLLCCDHCPAAYHPACLGYTPQQVAKLRRWQCPQHRCIECDRAAHAVGGLLFRCQVCPYAYCLDHLPEDHVLLESVNPRWEAMGYGYISVASYVHCTQDCANHAAKIAPQLEAAARKASGAKKAKTITSTAGKATANPSPKQKENVMHAHAHGHANGIC